MITINGKEYESDDLTDEQKYMVNQVSLCQQKAAPLEAESQIYRAAEQAYTDVLVKSLDD